AMLQEAYDQIVTIWESGDEPVALEGQYASMPPRIVVPKPIQKPHPPLWTACTSPQSYEMAGQNGTGVLAFGWAISPEALSRQIDKYRSALRAADRGDRQVND